MRPHNRCRRAQACRNDPRHCDPAVRDDCADEIEVLKQWLEQVKAGLAIANPPSPAHVMLEFVHSA